MTHCFQIIQYQELNKSLWSMTYIWNTGPHDQISHHSGEKKYFPDGGSFNDVVDFEELICNRQGLTVSWTIVVLFLLFQVFQG